MRSIRDCSGEERFNRLSAPVDILAGKMNTIRPLTAFTAPTRSSAPPTDKPDQFVPSDGSLLRPRSVVVVGGTDKPGKPGCTITRNLLASFPGETYVVNKRGGEIFGKQAYGSVSDLPSGVDMAVVTVPAEQVEGVLKECAERKIGSAVIISAGFDETAEGKGRAAEVKQFAHDHGMRLMGPNCLGVINTQVGLNASFAITPANPGNVALLAQSGGVLISLMGVAEEKGFGFSTLASLGNKMDLQESDLLKELQNDHQTRVVAIYTEGLHDGREFVEQAMKTAEKMPVLLLKGGKSSSGAQAASSHTGSLAGSTTVFNAAMKQAGVIQVQDEEELADLAMAFADQPLPEGRKLAVVTNGGGPGIIVTDNATEKFGLEMATLDPARVAALDARLDELGAPHAGMNNPIDVVGDAKEDRYRAAMTAALEDPGVDLALVVLVAAGPAEMEKTAQTLGELSRQYGKPVAASFMGGKMTAEAQKILRQNKIPTYSVPSRAARALGAMADYAEARRTSHAEAACALPAPDKAAAQAVLDRAAKAGRTMLSAQDCFDLLAAYHIPAVGSRLAQSPDQAVELASSLGFPVVMKIASEDVVHKKDVGGVVLNIKTPDEARAAYEQILGNVQQHKPDARIDGIQILQMADTKGTKEIIAGLKYDETFGPTLMTGLGGIYVEVFKDVKFALAPVTPEKAHGMLSELQAYKLLQGARGDRPSDVEGLSQVLSRVSQLGADFPQIGELDINPLLVSERGVVAVDARVSLRGRS